MSEVIRPLAYSSLAAPQPPVLVDATPIMPSEGTLLVMGTVIVPPRRGWSATVPSSLRPLFVGVEGSGATHAVSASVRHINDIATRRVAVDIRPSPFTSFRTAA